MLLEHISHLFSGVAITDFEQVSVCLVIVNIFELIVMKYNELKLKNDNLRGILEKVIVQVLISFGSTSVFLERQSSRQTPVQRQK